MRKLIFIILFLFVEKVIAQFPLTFKPIGQGDCRPFRIENSYDSGILLTGGYDTIPEIFKLDANGKVLWKRGFNSKVEVNYLTFKQASDGGYFVYGISYLYDPIWGDGFLCKINSCGEQEWGTIFRIESSCWVNDVSELGNDKLLIVQSGNSFRKGEFLYTHLGIFNTTTKTIDKQIRIPTEPLYKKTINYSSRFYNFATWAFRVKSDSTIYDLGSSQVEYDSTLSNFKIKYFKPFEIQNTHPIILASPIFMDNGNLISGGMFPGIRSEIAYPMAFVKYDKDLNRVAYHDMGHVRKGDGYGVEAVEYLKKINEEKFISIVNYEPRNDYFLTGNNDVEFYIVDTNFNELKKITYGDTANYKYHFKDAINTFDGHLLVLMHRYKNDYDIAYELAKFDKDLNLVIGKVMPKQYDFKCKMGIDSFNLINLNNFDTVRMKNWEPIAHSTLINSIFNSENGPSLYPNPSSGNVFVKLDKQETGRLKVYNSIGQLVFEQTFIKSDNFEVKLPSNLKGYLYFKIESINYNKFKIIYVY